MPAHVDGDDAAEGCEAIQDALHLRRAPAVREAVDDDEAHREWIRALVRPVHRADVHTVDGAQGAQGALHIAGHGPILPPVRFPLTRRLPRAS